MTKVWVPFFNFKSIKFPRLKAPFGVGFDVQNGPRRPRRPLFGREGPFFWANAPREGPSKALPTTLRGVAFYNKNSRCLRRMLSFRALLSECPPSALRVAFPARRMGGEGPVPVAGADGLSGGQVAGGGPERDDKTVPVGTAGGYVFALRHRDQPKHT